MVNLSLNSVNIDSIKSDKLRREIEELNPNKRSKIVQLNELTPSWLLDLDQGDHIQLSNDQVRLLEDLKKTGVCYGNKKPKGLDDMLINELPQWIFDELPDSITAQGLISELRDINLPLNAYNAR